MTKTNQAKFLSVIAAFILGFASSVTLVSCASTSHQESAGQYIDNSVITSRVKTRLAADKEIRSLSISVESYKGIVQLSGFVDSNYQRLKAADIARQVPGVVKIKNDLVIKNK